MMGFRMVLSALVCSMIASLAMAQTSGLARLSDREDLLGWEAVGRIDMAGAGFCTGTLIASDLVLTAAHCVYHPETKALVQADQLMFRAGLRDGTAIAERVVAQIAAHSGYDPEGAFNGENVRYDVALLRLRDPITTTQANPFVLHKGAVPGSTVSVVSYGQGRAEALSRQRECRMVGNYDDVMAFDCNVTFGSSGAPVFARTGNRGRIVSVVSGMTIINGTKLAVGMSLPAVVDRLKRDMRAQQQRPTASVRRVTVGDNRSGTGAKFVKP